MLNRSLMLMLCSASLAPALWPQTGAQTAATQFTISGYPVQWPAGPPRSALPAWAAPGRIRFAQWDGGPIELAKAMLSGWPFFNPPNPEYLYTITNWYDLKTVRFLREASINAIWVTFSNGFSMESERTHQQRLRLYMDECRRQGIHVLAYECLTTMFWEDMFERVPESRNWLWLDKDGKPLEYYSADVSKTGRVTRYKGDLAKPGWRAYVRKKIDLAIDAGADGVVLDNSGGIPFPLLLETYQDLYEHGASRQKNFILMSWFHPSTWAFNHLANWVANEDGVEPGVYAEENLTITPADKNRVTGSNPVKRERFSLLPVKDGFLVNNIGLLRTQSALSEGWKPATMQDGARETGNRWTTPMSGPRHQLALAESMMFGIGQHARIQGVISHGLMHDDPEVQAIWRAIGQYNRFFADNEDYYADTRSLASVAVVLDDRTTSIPLLNGLAGRKLLYDVVYEHDLTAARLAPYAAVALLGAETVRGQALSALEDYLSKGGEVIAVENAGSLDETGRPRPRPRFVGRNIGKGKYAYYERTPTLDELTKILRAADRPGPVQVEAPPEVLYNVVSQPKAGRLLVHLLNYTLKPISGIKVKVRGTSSGARLLSPDTGREPLRIRPSSDSHLELEVPRLDIYCVLVLENSRVRN